MPFNFTCLNKWSLIYDQTFNEHLELQQLRKGCSGRSANSGNPALAFAHWVIRASSKGFMGILRGTEQLRSKSPGEG